MKVRFTTGTPRRGVVHVYHCGPGAGVFSGADGRGRSNEQRTGNLTSQAADTDGDGLSDGVETKSFMVTWTEPTNAVIHADLLDDSALAAQGLHVVLLHSNGTVGAGLQWRGRIERAGQFDECDGGWRRQRAQSGRAS